MKRIVILISGRGSNMRAIVDAALAERWPAQIVAVISNRADAEGLAFATARQIPTLVLPSKQYPGRAAFDSVLAAAIDDHAPDLVVLAGFMRILTPAFTERYAGRLLNIHPSLLPSFPGLDTHARALQAGVKLHGATVHFVTSELDGGPIIAQQAVAVLPDDDEERLAARVLAVEHVMYPRVVRAFVEGRVRLERERAWIVEPAPAAADAGSARERTA